MVVPAGRGLADGGTSLSSNGSPRSPGENSIIVQYLHNIFVNIVIFCFLF